ncbi:protein yippee-like [Sesamum angolense]|uniref:Mitochondrial inner membrane protease subunit 2 n=1 Tax=Sesamum angolense TaxID=2727404 RepID=A0AAE1WFG1_9LAMI|nr:protein yippee-like [Sesamum angolense]
MAAQGLLWSSAKKCFTAGLIGLTVSDRYASFMAVRGSSMSPTLNPNNKNSSGFVFDDYVLVEKFCLDKYKFSRGDVVVFRVEVWIHLPSLDTVRIPEGHCWVVGDNAACSMDSRSLGPIPLGLICGRITHVVWPPQRLGRVDALVHCGHAVTEYWSCALARFCVCVGDDDLPFAIWNVMSEACTCLHTSTCQSFHCRHGKAYLFDKVVNVTVGEKEERMMMTGMHTVVDIFCVACGSIVDGNMFKVLGPDGSNYSITQDTQMAGSDADDVLFSGVLTIQLF